MTLLTVSGTLWTTKVTFYFNHMMTTNFHLEEMSKLIFLALALRQSEYWRAKGKKDSFIFKFFKF